jgi:SAM-dependent methyltransferase
MERSSSAWKALPRQLAGKIRRDGAARTLRQAWFVAHTRSLDWWYGIRTEATIPWHRLGDDPDAVDYEATSYRTLQLVFREIQISGQDVFLDYGCGMGRPLVCAARRPFQRVIGVEASPALCRWARANLRAARGLKCSQTEVVNCPAEHYALPDDVNVIFMFNPFRGRMLQAVIQEIHASLERRWRAMSLLYLIPASAENPLAESPALKVQRELPTEGLRLIVHRSLPAEERP